MIESTAIIHPTAKVADNVSIGHWSVIGPYVEIQEGTSIGSHVVINGPTRIGKNNRIYEFASVGGAPQDKKYQGEDTVLEIGDNNTIREYCTLNRGTNLGGGVTRIGNNNWLMAYVHIAHDCIVGNDTIFANNASLAGHVHVGDYAILSAFSGIHQFCYVGAHSFIGGATYIGKDILPFVLVAGGYTPATCGINTEGLKRRGFNSEMIDTLRRAYKVIFRRGLTVQQAIDELQGFPESTDLNMLIDALKKSERGIVR